MRKIGDILLDRDLINKEQLNQALERQTKSKKYLGQILVEMCIISEDVLTDIQASLLGLNVISTDTLKIHPKIIQFIPKSIAIKYRLVPIYIEPNAGKNTLCMLTSEEPPSSIISKMSEKLNIPIKLFLATYSELEALLVTHYDKIEQKLVIDKFKQNLANANLEPEKNSSLGFDDIPTRNEGIALEKNLEEDDEPILSGDLIEDDEPILSGDLIEDDLVTEEENNVTSNYKIPEIKPIEATKPIASASTKKESIDKKPINLDDEVLFDGFELDEESKKDLFNTGVSKPKAKVEEEDIVVEAKKVSDDVVLDLFDEIPDPSIKIESEEGNVPTLTINRDKPKTPPKNTKASDESEKEAKKLNFLEAFKSEDEDDYEEVSLEEDDASEIDTIEELAPEIETGIDLKSEKAPKQEEVFNKSTENIYIDMDEELAKDELSFEEQLEKTDNDDFPFTLDDLVSDSSKGKAKDGPNKKSPPPFSGSKPLPKPIPKPKSQPRNNDPQNVDKSGFPKPEIKEFHEFGDGDGETNPGTTQKLNLKEKQATDEWLKKNKNREIPDLDSIFGSDDVLDPLDNKKIDKLILSKKISKLQTNLLDFLKNKKVDKKSINKFKEFFNDLENNPANIILVSMLEMILLAENPNLDLFFDMVLKNINNGNSKNK